MSPDNPQRLTVCWFCIVLAIQGISKVYRLFDKPSDRLRQLAPFFSMKPKEFWALRDITFEVGKGEIVSLIGPNGCGKSTLLQIVSGILQPTSGRVVTRGRLAALLELGAGFNPEFTGRENVFLNGEILGFSPAEIARMLPGIEDFAGIGDFIDRPVKEYSSGMYVRLAFATAIHVDPEILVVDEALAVGDAIFANRCIRKFEELKDKGVTILFVSHDLGLVKQLSHRAVFLLNGEIQAIGSPKDVIDRYIGMVLERQKSDREKSQGSTKLRSSFRHGDGSSEVLDVQLLDEEGRSSLVILSGRQIAIRVRTRYHRRAVEPMIGVLIRTRIGIDVYGTNTRVDKFDTGTVEPGEEVEVTFRFTCNLTPQQYTLTVATQNPDGSSHDWLDDVLSFDVVSERQAAGLVDLQARIDWQVHSPDSAVQTEHVEK
jgi:lipopolysaccharide transport system ATP-binding protein